MTIRHLPDFLKRGYRTALPEPAKTDTRAPIPIGGNGDPALTYAWRDWMRHVDGGRIGG
jgi:hypothetical protein